MNNNLKELQTLILNDIFAIDSILFSRKCKITFTDMIYYLSKLINNESSS